MTDPQQTTEAMRWAILYLVANRDPTLLAGDAPVTFVELEALPGAKGDSSLTEEDGNLVYWTGLSEVACKALRELMDEGALEPVPVPVADYEAAGKVLPLPLAKSGAERMDDDPSYSAKVGAAKARARAEAEPAQLAYVKEETPLPPYSTPHWLPLGFYSGASPETLVDDEGDRLNWDHRLHSKRPN